MRVNLPQNVYDIDLRKYGSHSTVLSLVRDGSYVLDVGSGPGLLAEELKRRGCSVVCLEKDPESARIAASRCDQVVQVDLESAEEPPINHCRFDAIVYADILEHLRDPMALIMKYSRYLKEDGSIVVSLPNIAQVWVRMNLLMGRFDYRERGILDESHLRFFTLDSANRLLSNAGYEILTIDYTIHPFWPSWSSRLVYKLTKAFPRLLAVQFIFKAVPLKSKSSNRGDSS